MSQVISLFDELKKGGYDACLMSTFSVDFPFYEDVLLRKMQSSGINHHLLLVDSNMCLAAMNERPPHKAGSHYVLAPMRCSGAFHPKLLLLLGKNKGMLAVGSHNATLSGFGQNLEITNVLRFNTGNNEQFLPVFQQAFKAFKLWLDSYGDELPSSVHESLSRTRNLSPWLTEDSVPFESSNHHLLFSAKNTPSLWQQFQPMLPSNINRIIGISAFFDTRLAFLDELVKLSAKPPLVAIQPDTVSAPELILDAPSIRLVDVNSVEGIQQGKRYVHAKLLYMLGETPVFVSGSANFSRPAWLAEGADKNAEAVLVVVGDEAESIAKSLFLHQLNDADKVASITEQLITHPSKAVTAVSLLLISDLGGESIDLAVQEDWPSDHSLAYADSFGGYHRIDAKRLNASWVIPRSVLHEGELISVVHGSEVIARIILLNITQLRHNSSAGRERDLQQALGSLNSDSPEFELLFKCIGEIMPNEPQKNKAATKTPIKSSSQDDGAPESLLTSIETERLQQASSGRARCSSGEVGSILDLFIYNLGNISRSDNAEAFGEDALGRNEEDLVGLEDNEETLIAEPNSGDELDKAARVRADKLCQRKLQTILSRTRQSTDNKSEDTLRRSIPFTLAVLVLTNELYLAQQRKRAEERNWVTNDYFCSVAEFLFLDLFSEKSPIEISESNLDLSSVYFSDEWAQILGYATWVAYHSDVMLKARLPVSASIEEQEALNWKNACWLFLAQRIANDPAAASVAAKLMAQEGREAEAWLNVLIASGKEIISDRRLPFSARFRIASSPKSAFEGYKFVTDISGGYIRLAGINAKKISNGFKDNFLDVFDV